MLQTKLSQGRWSFESGAEKTLWTSEQWKHLVVVEGWTGKNLSIRYGETIRGNDTIYYDTTGVTIYWGFFSCSPSMILVSQREQKDPHSRYSIVKRHFSVSTPVDLKTKFHSTFFFWIKVDQRDHRLPAPEPHQFSPRTMMYGGESTSQQSIHQSRTNHSLSGPQSCWLMTDAERRGTQ